MKTPITVLAIALLFAALSVTGCGPIGPAPTPTIYPTFTSSLSVTPSDIGAIEKIRAALELPQLPIEFIETTGMINSPTGSLQVTIYQDPEGRKYSVEPITNQVVEIDARALLPTSHETSPSTPTFSGEELEAKAMQYMRAAIPDFDNLQSSWEYLDGGKIDNFFFSWYEKMTPGDLNRPFAQIGLHKSGVLFAYYNTLLLNK
jgi:hypothetical protein